MATTTNYGWTTPDDTALVKDGAAAIRTLGTSVDTTTKNLNPSTTLGDIEYRSSTANTNTRLGIGTSGQNLSVVAGVPSWTASASSVLTTTGDTLYASAANTLARLGIGTTGQILAVSGGLPSWTTPASAGGMTLLNSGGTTLSGSATTVSFSSTGYTNLQIQVKNGSFNANANGFHLRVNSDTASNYASMRYMNYNAGSSLDSNTSGDTEIILANRLGNTSTPYQTGNAVINIYRPTDTDYFYITWDASGYNNTLTNPWYVKGTGFYNGTTDVTSITITADSSTWNAGTIYVYGVK